MPYLSPISVGDRPPVHELMYIAEISGAAEDDWVLQLIILVGTVCNDDVSAKMLAEASIIQSLIELLNGLYSQLIYYPPPQNVVLQSVVR